MSLFSYLKKFIFIIYITLVCINLSQVESVVLKRYGKDPYRIFRLLSKANRLLETDKVR